MAEFLDDTGPDDFAGWMSLLRRDELVDLAKDRRISPTGKTVCTLYIIKTPNLNIPMVSNAD